MRLRDRIKARAARKFSDVELEGNPPQRDPVRDRFSGAGKVRRADGADCCTETGSGCGIKSF